MNETGGEMRSALGRVRGLGAARGGAAHWWAQRLTAVALVPLTLWFVVSALSLAGADYPVFQEWLGTFGNAVLMILLIITMFYHAELGVRTVIEDYVHAEAAKITTLIAARFIFVIMGAASVLAVVKVAVLV